MDADFIYKMIVPLLLTFVGAGLTMAVTRWNRRYRIEHAEACLKALGTAELNIKNPKDVHRLHESKEFHSIRILDLSRRGTPFEMNDNLRSFRNRSILYRALFIPPIEGAWWYLALLHYYAILLFCTSFVSFLFDIKDSGPPAWLVGIFMLLVEVLIRYDYWVSVRKNKPDVFR